ncbi:MAG: helix-turn-helix transcriptional regulator [Clostridia bacterium]|nr:helix-turn-helix transcriptional regulator [Clostridia bacterium]
MKYEKTLIDIKTDIVSSDTMYSLILINADALTLTLNGVRCYLTGRFLLCLSVEDTVAVHGGQHEAINLQFLPFFYNVNLNHEIIGMPIYEEMRARHGYPDFHLFRTRNTEYIGILQLTEHEYDMMQTHFQRAKIHVNDHDTDVMWSCNTRSALITILQIAERAYCASGDLKEDEVLHYIRENLDKDLSLSALSRYFHTNRTTLTEMVKSMTGMTPAQYVLEQRLNVSRPDLLFTSVPITQIAEKYGFTDPNYYIRAFKKRFGKSPLQYRKDSYDNRLRHENAYRALAERVREFEQYVKGGLGCAVLMLRKEEEKSSFRKVLVDFLLGNEKHLRTYGFYEKTLIEAFPDSEVLARKIAEGLLARIKEGKCFFALPLLSELGYKEDALAQLEGEYAQAYAILVERLKSGNDSEDTDAVATRYTSAARALGQYAQYTDCDDDRLFRILSDIADLYKYSEHPPVPEKNNPIFSMVAGIGKARFLPLLRRVEAEHPFGKKLDVHKDFPKKKSIAPPITAEDILSREGFFDTEYPALFDAFASSPPWVHTEIAHAALDEADPKRKAYLLSFFASTTHPQGHPVFPLDPDPLIREAERILENCQNKLTYEETCFFEVLSCLQNPPIRALGEKLLQLAEAFPNEPNADFFKRRGIVMRFLNYEPSDKARFSEILLNSTDAEPFELFAELIRKKTPGLPMELVPYALHNTSVYGIRPQLAEALAESGMMTEDIFEECRYDACERTRRAVDTHKVKKELLQFETDYKRGHGRAILTVRNAEDKEPYKKRIVSLLTNNSIIPHPLGTYDRDLIECFPDSDKVLSEIVGTLLKKFSDKNILPYLPMACKEISLLRTLGYTEKITDILNVHYEKAYTDLIEYIKTDNSNQGALPVSAYFGLICAYMRGLHADRTVAKKLLLDMAELYAYADEPILPHKSGVLTTFYPLGEEELDTLLTEIEAEHRFGDKIRKRITKHARRLPTAEPNISTEEFLSSYERTRQPGCSPTEFLRMHHSLTVASEETVRAVAQAALDNFENEKGVYYLSLFAPTTVTPHKRIYTHFPLDVTPILEKAEAMEIIAGGMYENNPEYYIHLQLCSFLSVVTDPRVKKLGKKILLDEKSDYMLKELACRMVWAANFEPDDIQDILAFLNLSHKTGDESLCTACLRCLSEQMKKNNVRLAPALVKDIFYMADYHIRPTVMEATLASGSRIDDILADCRWDAHEKIREMAAKADAEVVVDKVCEFAEDISKGLGRAILTVCKAEDKAPYRKALVSFIADQSALTGKWISPTFDAYLFELIRLFPDSDSIIAEITPLLFSYLKEGRKLVSLPLLLRLGYEEEVRAIMEEMYKTAYDGLVKYEKAGADGDASHLAHLFTCAAESQVHELHGGEARAKEILLDIADLYDYTDAPFLSVKFNPVLGLVRNDETLLRLLEQIAAEHRNGQKLLAHNTTSLHDPSLTPAKENLTLADLLTVKVENSESYYAVSKAFLDAPDSLVRAFAEEIVKEKDPKKLGGLLAPFNFGIRTSRVDKKKAPVFPLDPTPLIEIAEQNTDTDPKTGFLPPEIAELYIFLAHLRHPAVRAWGERLYTAEGKNLCSYAVIAFENNYVPKDGAYLERMAKEAPYPMRNFCRQTAERLIAAEADGISEELMRYCFYNTENCYSRLRIVHAWLKRGTMPADVREDCLYAGYDEIRRLVKEGHRDTADFIAFEKAVIHRIFKEVPEYEENLCRQYRSVVVADRKFTGHGFCTTFYGVTVPYSLGKDVNLTLGKVSATLNDGQHGAGFVLFIEGGVISCLEGCAYDEPWPEKIEKYAFDEAEKTEQEL